MAADRRWLAVMLGFTVVEFVWWALAWRAGIAPVPLIGTYFAFALGGLAAGLALRFVIRLGPARASWPAILCGTALVAMGASLFLPLKYAIPNEIPFWLDQPLASFERTMFGGDPWRVLDRLIGWSARSMDWLYGCWLPTQLVALFCVMLARPSREKDLALIAYSAAWFLLGVLGAVLLSSAGPLFFDRAFGGTAFAELAEMLRSRGAWIAIAESDRMWASTSVARPGLVAGISAMPSIHVAISLWMFLCARTMAPRLAGLAATYFVLIWVGSVQLGWHYASDGLVGAAGMASIWMLARLGVSRSHGRPGKRIAA